MAFRAARTRRGILLGPHADRPRQSPSMQIPPNPSDNPLSNGAGLRAEGVRIHGGSDDRFSQSKISMPAMARAACCTESRFLWPRATSRPASRRETPRMRLTHGHRAGPGCFPLDFNDIAAQFQIHDAPIVVSGAMAPSCDAAPCCERFLTALTLANASHYQLSVMWSTRLSGPGTRS